MDAFPIPDLLIPRIAEVHNYSLAYAAGALKEAKRMLYLAALGHTISPSEHIDPAWHEMLMFTRFYQSFADYIGGYIHHDPTPGVPDGGRTYEATKMLYKEVLGEEPDPQYWP